MLTGAHERQTFCVALAVPVPWEAFPGLRTFALAAPCAY